VKRKKIAGESVPPSFTSSLIDENEGSGGGIAGEEVISGAAATLYGGGSDTTASAIATFILAMARYPEIQAKAQAEMDKVVGDRLPTYNDKDSLPYLNAVVLETLRWHPVGPNGVPHRLTKDDTYNGYFIPSGTIVTVNIWGILHDERHFPDPLAFNPDRFLTGESKLSDGTPRLDPLAAVFGYGRRICPGMHVVQTGLWIAIAMLISSFEVTPKADPETGEPLTPEAKWTGVNISSPVPFVCNIRPRSKARANFIRDTVAEEILLNDAV